MQCPSILAGGEMSTCTCIKGNFKMVSQSRKIIFSMSTGNTGYVHRPCKNTACIYTTQWLHLHSCSGGFSGSPGFAEDQWHDRSSQRIWIHAPQFLYTDFRLPNLNNNQISWEFLATLYCKWPADKMVEAGTRRSTNKMMHCFCGTIRNGDEPSSQRFPEWDLWTENKNWDFSHVRNSHQS